MIVPSLDCTVILLILYKIEIRFHSIPSSNRDSPVDYKVHPDIYQNNYKSYPLPQ